MISAQRSTFPGVHPDVIVGVGLAACAALTAFVVIPVWIEPASYDAGWQQSPRLMPWLSTAVVGLLGLVIAWRARRRKCLDEGEEFGPTLLVTMRAVVLVLTAIIANVVLATIIGMVSAGVIVCFSLMLLVGERHPLILLVAGVAIPAAIVELLKVVGSVPMPVGPLGF